MSALNFSSPSEPQAASVADRAAARASTAGRRRSAVPGQAKGGKSPVAVAPHGRLAPFAPLETAAVKGEIWPLHAGTWLQPELRPSIPAASDLRIERLHKIVVARFVKPEIRPASPVCPLEEPDMIRPAVRVHFPVADLEPHGWNPRLACACAGSAGADCMASSTVERHNPAAKGGRE